MNLSSFSQLNNTYILLPCHSLYLHKYITTSYFISQIPITYSPYENTFLKNNFTLELHSLALDPLSNSFHKFTSPEMLIQKPISIIFLLKKKSSYNIKIHKNAPNKHFQNANSITHCRSENCIP